MITLPKGERTWAAYYDSTHALRYIITSKEASRDAYYLYEVPGELLKKLGKGKSPRELEERFKIEGKVRDAP